jgi:hypothetical protein
MLILRVWDQSGLTSTHFSPAENYASEADRFAPARPLVDARGTGYYVSAPPFAYLLAFAAHRCLPQADLRLVLKGLNLALLLPATWALFAILSRNVGRNIALAGCAVFLFNRAVLLSLGNLYYPGILVVPLWVTLVCYYERIHEAHPSSKLPGVTIFLGTFLLAYTDWIGYLVAASFIAWPFLAKEPVGSIRRRVARFSLFGASAAAALTVFQYASIAGFTRFVQALGGRFQHRTGINTEAGDPLTLWNPKTYVMILENYRFQYRYLIAAIAIAILVLVILRSLKDSIIHYQSAKCALFCFAAPILLEHALIPNFGANHNFVELKGAPILAVVASLAFAAVVRQLIALKPDFRRGVLAAAVIAVCVLAIRSFEHERNDLAPTDAILGDAIHANARPSEVVFLEKRSPVDTVRPNLNYFSSRNVMMVSDLSEGIQLLSQRGMKEGVLFQADLNGNLTVPPTHFRIPYAEMSNASTKPPLRDVKLLAVRSAAANP